MSPSPEQEGPPPYTPPPLTIYEVGRIADAIPDAGIRDTINVAEWIEWVTDVSKIVVAPPLRFAPDDGTFVVFYKGRGRDEARALALAILRAIEGP